MVQATLGKERIAREVLPFILAEMAKDPEAERTKKQAIMDDAKHAYWKQHNANWKPAKDFDDAYELAVMEFPAYGKLDTASARAPNSLTTAWSETDGRSANRTVAGVPTISCDAVSKLTLKEISKASGE